MSRDTALDQSFIESCDDLLAYFQAGCKTHGPLKIGVEHEKFGFWTAPDGTLTPIPFEGGIGEVMQALAERFGWTAISDAGHITALERDGGAVTIEPGGQFELSGAIFEHLAEIEHELHTHLREVAHVSEPLGIRWLLLGHQPFAAVDDVSWMPKSRYGIMAKYLPTRGVLAHDMMKLTCTVQANFDYTSEDDAADILKTILRITPIVSALFATSPFYRGTPSGDVSRRCRIWTQTDPDRTGYIRSMLEPGYTFRDYLNYLLDVPMICIRREGHGYIDTTGRTFREFIEHGFQGHRATLGDWEVHVSMIWPEVRMKRYIEVRGADVVPPALIMAFTAFWKGILYDLNARHQAAALTEDLSFEARLDLHARMIREGLSARLTTAHAAPSLLELARTLFTIATQGLQRIASNEIHYLQPLQTAILEHGQSIAEQQLAAFHRGDNLLHILEPFWLADANTLTQQSGLV